MIKKLFKFTVEGSHEFPWDMLRYDRCWPRAEAEITSLAPFPRGEAYRNKRQVRLIGLSEPTQGRWESFGWAVVPPIEEQSA